MRLWLGIGLVLLAAMPSWAEEPAQQSADSAAGPSKKEQYLAEKAARHAVRRTRLPEAATKASMPVSLVNRWTLEVLPVDPAAPPPQAAVSEFLRCHFTNQATSMDQRLLGVVLAAARKFGSHLVEVVSGFRAPKYNLLLRKKGHEVAKNSQHTLGHAVDFRLPGLPTRTLLRFVRGLHLGGVGYYPHSSFVHADVGPVRFWRGH